MAIFHPQSIDNRKMMTPTMPSFSPRRSQYRQLKDPPGGGNSNPKNDDVALSLRRSSNAPHSDPSGVHHDRDVLEQKARAFFKMAKISDRRESRYNAHGNRASWNGQKQKLHRQVFAGAEAVDSMVESGLASSRKEAVRLAKRLATELNLFVRANPPSSSNNSPSSKPKGKAKANLLVAQTILLGSNDAPEGPSDDRNIANTHAEDCFVDDINAFYRFGGGVLAIIRGIDRDDEKASLSPPTTKGLVAESSYDTTSTDDTSFEASFESSSSGYDPVLPREKHSRSATDKNKSFINHGLEERSLSITPNAPGRNGNHLALEDLFVARNKTLFMTRHPEMADTANGDNTKPSRESVARNKSKSNGKKKTKKSAPLPHPSASIPPPLPKSILKNSNSNKINQTKSKKNKNHVSSKANKASRNKTKGIIKKTQKIKAGAKIKYVSDKEQRIAQIEKRLLFYHSDHEVALHRNMLKELKMRLSRVYTGDHFEIVSLSSHSSPPTPPQNPHSNSNTFVKDGLSTLEPSLGDKRDIENSGTNEDDHGAFDDGLDSLDAIIASNAGLLTGGDDSASVWTEFIMGTSGATKEANKEIEPDVAKQEKDVEAKPKATKKETRLASSVPKASKQPKRKSNKLRGLPSVNEEQQLGKEERSFQQQHQQQKKKQPIIGWKAPAPLEKSKRGKASKKKSRSDRNEIDLTSWAMVFQNGPKVGCGIPDDVCSQAPDDLSLLLEQHQDRESKSIHMRKEDTIAKDQIQTEKNHRKREDSKRNEISRPTKESKYQMRLRQAPCRNNVSEKLTSLSEIDDIVKGKVGTCKDRNRNRHNQETNAKATDGPSKPPPQTPNIFDGDTCNASNDSNSGIMDAIEQDHFYKKANGELEATSSRQQVDDSARNKGSKNHCPPPLPPETLSPCTEPGSFTASYMENDFEESCNEFEEETFATFSDEESYMEITVKDGELSLVGTEEMIEEIVEDEYEDIDEIVEEVDEDELITYVSELDFTTPESRKNEIRPALSPKRRASEFRSARSLPSVPEFETELVQEHQPQMPRRKSSFYLEVPSMADDDMTQITMDNCFLGSSFRSNRSLHVIPEDEYAINGSEYTTSNSYLFNGSDTKHVSRPTSDNDLQLMPSAPAPRHKNKFSAPQQLKKRTKHVASSSSPGRHCNTVLSTETSHERIREILFKDLYSSDITIVCGALEELQILVANESRSRAYLVRYGGVMVIINTMDDQLEVEPVQFLCCNILEQLASVDVEVCLTILEVGGITLIEKAIERHANSSRVKEVGSTALTALSRNS